MTNIVTNRAEFLALPKGTTILDSFDLGLGPEFPTRQAWTNDGDGWFHWNREASDCNGQYELTITFPAIVLD